MCCKYRYHFPLCRPVRGETRDGTERRKGSDDVFALQWQRRNIARGSCGSFKRFKGRGVAKAWMLRSTLRSVDRCALIFETRFAIEVANTV